jgi:hypothetical protein
MEHRNKHNIRVKDKRTLYSLIFTTNTIDFKLLYIILDLELIFIVIYFVMHTH